ncbi:MAG: DUF2752 domain-containing protein [Bacteroidota bacterium]
MKKTLHKVLLLSLVTGPFYLLWLPADYFDQGETLCLYKNVFDFNCPGCGLTRGLMHLLHLDVAAAWGFSPFAFVVAPLLGMLWLHLLGKLIGRKIFSFFEKYY